jgi:hypothetical protein
LENTEKKLQKRFKEGISPLFKISKILPKNQKSPRKRKSKKGFRSLYYLNSPQKSENDDSDLVSHGISPECSNESIWRKHLIEIDVNKQKSPSDPRTSARLSGAISRIEQERADAAIREATKWTKSPKLKRQKRDGQEIAEIAERRSARFEAALQREQERKNRQETAQNLKRQRKNNESQNKKRQKEKPEETINRQKKDAEHMLIDVK